MSDSITDIVIIVLRFPMLHFISGWKYIDESLHLMTLVKTENSVYGVGEGIPYGTRIHEDYIMAVKLRKILIGQTVDEAIRIVNEVEHKALLSKNKINYGAFLAMESALLDALAKLRKVSIASLLGGEYRDHVQVAGTVFLKHPLKMAEEINTWILKGVKHIKIKIPRNLGDLEETLKIITRKSSLKEIGATLRVDANQCFEYYDKAVKALEIMEKYEVDIVEQPLPKNALEDTAKLRKRFYPTLKIMLDESLIKPQDIETFCHLEAADIVNFHPPKLGCMTLTHNTILEAQKYGLEVQIGSALFTEVGLIHYVNLAASIPKLDYPLEEVSMYPFYGYSIYQEPCVLKGGAINAVKYKNVDLKKLTFRIVKKVNEYKHNLFAILSQRVKNFVRSLDILKVKLVI